MKSHSVKWGFFNFWHGSCKFTVQLKSSFDSSEKIKLREGGAAMNLVRWNPLGGLIRKDNWFLDDSWHENSRAFVPRVEVFEKDGKLNLHAELPGMKKEDVNITLTDGVLSIEGHAKSEREEEKEGYFYSERSYGNFHRQFEVPDNVNPEDIQALFEDGILKVTLPYKKKEVKKIEVS